MAKNWRGLNDRGTLKSGISQKSFDELSRLTQLFLHPDSHRILLF